MTNWIRTHRGHLETRLIADRHYNRQKPGTAQFVPPGRCLVLLHNTGKAFWVTSWPYAEYVKHNWPGAWICSAFRSENAGIASVLIEEAILETLYYFGPPPDLRMITFIDTKKVQPIKCRGINTWGYTYKKAGFQHVGETKKGLLAFQIVPETIKNIYRKYK